MTSPQISQPVSISLDNLFSKTTYMARTQAIDTPHRRPTMLNRALSSPPTSPVSPFDAFHTPSTPTPKLGEKQLASILTPPTSPQLMRTSSNFSRTPQSPTNAYSTPNREHIFPGADFDGTSDEASDLGKLIECGFDVEPLKDQRGREQIFGTGAWSTVSKAIGKVRYDIVNRAAVSSTRRQSIPVLVAVKSPSRVEAIPIIKSEALIMSKLAQTSDCDEYVVRFYGIIQASCSLVLAPLPLSLEDHIISCAFKETRSRSTWDVPGPVIGSTSIWLDLATRSTSALAWLHNEAGVVHGDIKPANILLRLSWQGEDRFGYDPLLADFSSGQIIDADVVTPNTLSAITREYAAPELLTSSVLKNRESAATSACDVFSLAVTLLVAVTGELMVYSGGMWQRQAMATQGWNVLNNVRNGEQGDRIPQSGIVQQVLEKAVLKLDEGRINAQAWKTLVERKAKAEPNKLTRR